MYFCMFKGLMCEILELVVKLVSAWERLCNGKGSIGNLMV